MAIKVASAFLIEERNGSMIETKLDYKRDNEKKMGELKRNFRTGLEEIVRKIPGTSSRLMLSVEGSWGGEIGPFYYDLYQIRIRDSKKTMGIIPRHKVIIEVLKAYPESLPVQGKEVGAKITLMAPEFGELASRIEELTKGIWQDAAAYSARISGSRSLFNCRAGSQIPFQLPTAPE